MASVGFKVFSGSIEKGGVVQAITVPGGAARVSSTRLKKGDVYQEALLAGAGGLTFLKVVEDGEDTLPWRAE